MEPADHIKEIKAAVRKINIEGHITQSDQYVAVSDLLDYVAALNVAFENLEGAVMKLGKTIEWHKFIGNTLSKHINGEITAGEEIEEGGND